MLKRLTIAVTRLQTNNFINIATVTISYYKGYYTANRIGCHIGYHIGYQTGYRLTYSIGYQTS